jgi:regulator of sirC expression with transglutaminase-like and TPR domain
MRSRLLTLTCVAGVMSTVLAPRPLYGDAGLVQRLEEIESAHPGLCPDAPPQAALHSTVRLWAAELRPGIATGAKPTEIVAALNHFLVEQLAIRSSQDLHDPCNLLPSAVVARRQGYCVGVAALYLALAQELELPMFAVATPSHVFLRYDDGMTTINIDTTQIGVSKSDAD